MTFADVLSKYPPEDLDSRLHGFTPARVETALAKDHLNPDDYLALLSPAAAAFLEPMAQKAHALSLRHFGRTVLLYAPLYLSNHCQNECLYCGFNIRNRIRRRQLTPAEAGTEAKIIAATGIRHILILTGENKARASTDYLQACLAALKNHFLSIAIEIYAADREEYATLMAAGVDQVTLYQETYNPEVYGRVHRRGPKRNFPYRLAAPERAGLAGMRGLNIGALLGLDNWTREAFCVGLHADYLQQRFPAAEVSVSLPRLRPHIGVFEPEFPVGDAQAVQFMLALRLFLPRAGITLSTREQAAFRDALLPLGVTRLSAGSSTAVGGYTGREATPGQFDIHDQRSVEQIQTAVRRQGYQPIFTDWQPLKT